jgi:hypothetical protein
LPGTDGGTWVPQESARRDCVSCSSLLWPTYLYPGLHAVHSPSLQSWAAFSSALVSPENEKLHSYRGQNIRGLNTRGSNLTAVMCTTVQVSNTAVVD